MKIIFFFLASILSTASVASPNPSFYLQASLIKGPYFFSQDRISLELCDATETCRIFGPDVSYPRNKLRWLSVKKGTKIFTSTAAVLLSFSLAGYLAYSQTQKEGVFHAKARDWNGFLNDNLPSQVNIETDPVSLGYRNHKNHGLAADHLVPPLVDKTVLPLKKVFTSDAQKTTFLVNKIGSNFLYYAPFALLTSVAFQLGGLSMDAILNRLFQDHLSSERKILAGISGHRRSVSKWFVNEKQYANLELMLQASFGE